VIRQSDLEKCRNLDYCANCELREQAGLTQQGLTQQELADMADGPYRLPPAAPA